MVMAQIQGSSNILFVSDCYFIQSASKKIVVIQVLYLESIASEIQKRKTKYSNLYCF
jgi:hypothetical protein